MTTHTGTWLCFAGRLSWLLLALMMPSRVAHAEPPPAPSSEVSGAASSKRLLYVGALASRGRPEADSLAPLVEVAILAGANAGLQPGAAFTGIFSAAQLAAQNAVAEGELRDFGSYAGRDILRELALATARLAKSGSLTFVRPVLYPLGEGKIRVDLEIYDDATQSLLRMTRLKSVGGCGEDNEEVLDRIREAARLVVSGHANRSPLAAISGFSTTKVKLGTGVTLDACNSRDPDEDAMVWAWSQEGASAPRLLSESFSARRIHLQPPAAGEYSFKLSVREAISAPPPPSSWQSRLSSLHFALNRAMKGQSWERTAPLPSNEIRIQFEVLEAPKANAGASAIHATPCGSEAGEQLGPIELDGSASRPTTARFRWKQTAGPRSKLEKDRKSCENDAKCAFQPTSEGLYAFELSVENALGTSSATVRYLVARCPRAAVAAYRPAVRPWNSLKLVSGSYDLIDPTPAFAWSIVSCGEGRTASECGAIITNPTDFEATFVPSLTGDYEVELRVVARRKLDGLETTSEQATTTTVSVQAPHWLAAIVPDFYYAGERDYHNGRPFVSPELGLMYTGGQDAVGPNWLTARLWLPIVRVDLSRTASVDRVERGGGPLLGLGYKGASRSPLVWRGFADFYFRLREDDAFGLGASLMPTWHLRNAWELFANVGYLHTWGFWLKSPNANLVRGAIGVGYGF